MNSKKNDFGYSIQVGKYKVPTFIYGTAWKGETTQDCVEKALDAGFQGIDTANQRKHYFEEGVGNAIDSRIKKGKIRRQDLFLQSKFTFRHGQDHRLPYDEKAGIAQQVRQSCAGSLDHLKTNYLDSYILHGPASQDGLTDDDFEAWKAMEELAREGKVRHLGVSNVYLEQLEELYLHANIKPTFVQIRCFARLAWNKDIRLFCKKYALVFQGFSLLTANVRELDHPRFQAIVKSLRKTPAQIVFRFALQSGMIPLTGTTDPTHMTDDFQIYDFSLSEEYMNSIATIAL